MVLGVAFLGLFGDIWVTILEVWGGPGGLLGRSGALLGASWALLWSILEAFGVHVGGSGDKIGVEHRHGRFPFSGRTVLEAS